MTHKIKTEPKYNANFADILSIFGMTGAFDFPVCNVGKWYENENDLQMEYYFSNYFMHFSFSLHKYTNNPFSFSVMVQSFLSSPLIATFAHDFVPSYLCILLVLSFHFSYAQYFLWNVVFKKFPLQIPKYRHFKCPRIFGTLFYIALTNCPLVSHKQNM